MTDRPIQPRVVLSMTFSDLLAFYLDPAKALEPRAFGLAGFSESDFVRNDYELIGDPQEFHFYEKAFEIRNGHRASTVVFKYYFNLTESLGSGLSIARGMRLTTFLKRLFLGLDDRRVDTRRLALFFSSDKRDGAIVIDDRLVVRFNQWSRRSAYVLSTIECDFSSETFGAIATQSVKTTFCADNLEKAVEQTRKTPAAYCRLMQTLWNLSHVAGQGGTGQR